MCCSLCPSALPLARLPLLLCPSTTSYAWVPAATGARRACGRQGCRSGDLRMWELTASCAQPWQGWATIDPQSQVREPTATLSARAQGQMRGKAPAQLPGGQLGGAQRSGPSARVTAVAPNQRPCAMSAWHGHSCHRMHAGAGTPHPPPAPTRGPRAGGPRGCAEGVLWEKTGQPQRPGQSACDGAQRRGPRMPNSRIDATGSLV